MTGTISEVRQEVLKVIWEIKDFLSLTGSVGKIIKSPAFQFSGSSYQLGVYPFGVRESSKGSVGLFLSLHKPSPSFSSTVIFTLAAKKSDGTFFKKNPVPHKFHDEVPFGFYDMLERSDLQLRKEEFLHGDALIFSCVLRKMPPAEAIDVLSAKFSKLLASSAHSNVRVKLQSREYRAHGAVLAAQSDVFASALEHDTLERESGVIQIDDCDPDSFEVFLQYLYTGCADIDEGNVYHLFKTADKYLVEELKAICVAFLIENMTVDNVCDAVALADDHSEIDLKNVCKDFFKNNVVSIIATSKWVDLLGEHSVAANELLKHFASQVQN